MDDAFKIYIEQLKDGHTERIKESFSPEFLEVKEQGLEYSSPVIVEGEVYVADDELVFHLDVTTKARIPCSVCNTPTDVAIDAKGVYHTEPLEEMKSGVFYFNEILREIVLLETPAFIECHDDNCPKRQELEGYFKKSNEVTSDQDEEGYRPFADLE